MSRLEYGVRYVVNSDGVPIKQKSRNKDFVIEGVACHYGQIIFHDEQFQCICATAFDVALKHEKPVQFWISHDESLHLENCKLELHSTKTELSFRLTLDDSELASHARDLVESKLYNEMSVGWNSGTSTIKEVDGRPVKFILRAVLEEISLVPTGVVKRTHAQISELKSCRSLRQDVESKKFGSDNTWAELSRKLQKWELES